MIKLLMIMIGKNIVYGRQSMYTTWTFYVTGNSFCTRNDNTLSSRQLTLRYTIVYIEQFEKLDSMTEPTDPASLCVG